MARTVPSDRLEKLLVAAAEAFVEHGFHRCQMDDVAARLGVSKGTVYRSVESKEALFVAVLDHADRPGSLPEAGPFDDPSIGDAAQRLGDRLAESVSSLALATAVADPHPPAGPAEVGDEIEAIVRDLYDVLASHRVGVMVLDRCAAELPELAAVWFGSGRYALVDLWDDYLARRAEPVTSAAPRAVLARSITELVTVWAVKMPWDPAPRSVPDDIGDACAAMVRNLVLAEPR